MTQKEWKIKTRSFEKWRNIFKKIESLATYVETTCGYCDIQEKKNPLDGCKGCPLNDGTCYGESGADDTLLEEVRLGLQGARMAAHKIECRIMDDMKSDPYREQQTFRHMISKIVGLIS